MEDTRDESPARRQPGAARSAQIQGLEQLRHKLAASCTPASSLSKPLVWTSRVRIKYRAVPSYQTSISLKRAIKPTKNMRVKKTLTHQKQISTSAMALKMTKCLFWSRAVCLGAAMVLFQPTLALSQQALEATDAEIDITLQKIARDINATLTPGNSDGAIVAVSALPGKRFVYKTQVAMPARRWSSELRARSRETAVNDYCTNPDLAPFRELGITVIWQLSDRQGNAITTNTASPKECPH